VHRILDELVEAGILSEVRFKGQEIIAYQPARDTDSMTLKSVMEALDAHGSDRIPVAQSEEMVKIEQSLKTFSDLIEKSPANLHLKDL
jgi:hypothetical protein